MKIFARCCDLTADEMYAVLHESHRQRQMLDLRNMLMAKHEKVQETRACNPNMYETDMTSFTRYLYVYNY